MLFLKALFIVVLMLCCLLLVGLILLQKSKSEGLGLAFGAGAGESLFGARAGNVLSKATVVIGITFLASALALGRMYAQDEKTVWDEAASEAPAAETVVPGLGDGLELGETDALPAETTPAP